MRPPLFPLVCLMIFLLGLPALSSAEPSQAKVNVTVIIASNKGSDYDLVNDEFRDRLIELFSYSSYRQVNAERLVLNRSERVIMTLPDGYELMLTLQDREKDRIVLQALVRKDGIQFVDTILSVVTPGIAFLGGPELIEGTLIIVLENGF